MDESEAVTQATTKSNVLSAKTKPELFSQLSRVTRKDGVNYFCWPEVKSNLFPDVSEGTLKEWIRSLNIVRLICTVEEHEHFNSYLPNIAPMGTQLKLISESEVNMLLEKSHARVLFPPNRKRKCLTADITSDPNPLAPIGFHQYQSSPYFRDPMLYYASSPMHVQTPNHYPLAWTSTGAAHPNCSSDRIGAQDVARVDFNHSLCATESVVGENKSDYTYAHVLSDDSDSCSDADGTLEKEDFKFKSRPSRKLSILELDDSAANEIQSFKAFYSRPLNTQRAGHYLQPITIEKLIERVLTFYKFAKENKKIASLRLALIEEGDLVEEFCNYLRSKERNLKSVTVSRYVSTFISVFRFLYRNKTAHAQESLASLSRLKALRSQLEFDSRSETFVTADTSQPKTILFEEILSIARQILHAFEDTRVGVDKARYLMNFCVLLLYTSVSPGRCKEFTTLQIASSAKASSTTEGNFLICEPEKIILLCKDYKTRKVYGEDRTLIEGTQLLYYLRLYMEKFRSKLLQGNVHDYLLVNNHGLPFTVPCFSAYLGRMFEKFCGVRLSVNNLRHALVTFFMSLPESSDSQLSKSIATIMKHSVRTQQRCYDSRSREVLKAPALAFLARNVTDNIFEVDNIDNSQDAASENEDGYLDALPVSGDFVALVASNSTLNSPEILLARVLRFSQNKKEVLLAHMEEISKNCFTQVLGKSYSERVETLIFPVDVIYLPSDRIYELRSDRIALHQQAKV